MNSNKIKTYKEFWPFYLSQHQNFTCQILHIAGTILSILSIILFVYLEFWLGFIFVPIIGYGFAWTGHFVFEKNKPATFKYPFWSFISDFKMIYWFFFKRKNS